VQPRLGMTWNRSLPESGCLIALNPLIDNAVRLLALMRLAGLCAPANLMPGMYHRKLLAQSDILIQVVPQHHGHVTSSYGLT
jgi:hypothetical protein